MSVSPGRSLHLLRLCSLLSALGFAMLAIAAWPASAQSAVSVETAAWEKELAAWRQRVDEGLRRERGWLSIIGRWELEPGAQRIGSARGSDIRLPKGLSPATLGTIHVHAGKARLVLAPGERMRVVGKDAPGEEFTERDLLPGREHLEWMTGGRLSLQVVRRDDGRFVLRAADRDAPLRRTFAGRIWYEPRRELVLPARFIPQPKGTTFPIANVRGEISYEEVAGQLELTLDGRTVRLDALDDAGNLFIIFRDATSGSTTYPPGRFLWIRKPADGAWIVDFNKAYNPPCTFSAYTTCPLPPPQNWMTLPVAAGERYAERKP